MKDFTLTAYRRLLGSLMEAGYCIITVEEYFEILSYEKEEPYNPLVVLRHDVDRRPQNALRMADIEIELGISSTYYFRKSTFNANIVKWIYGLGHEIGYHYEVMDKARGDIGLAHAIFNSEIEILRAWVPVKTCAAHGNPVSKYDNRNFFDSFDPEQFGLVGEAEKVGSHYYWTDTGRGIVEYNIKDHLDRNPQGKPAEAYYSIHPERWNDGLAWYRQWVWDWGCNLVKRCLRARIA